MTERFYSEYKRIYATLKGRIVGFADEGELDLFSQTLLNRLMFVHFVSRKGWFTYDGSTDYLDAMWSDHRSQALWSNFYVTHLKPLFFYSLNDPQSSELNRDGPTFHAAIGDVPFLSGGLFDANELDRREGVHVPDEAIEPVITELFGRFDFTITESTLHDAEVAVDPELLGMVFEELVNEWHDIRDYHTPRPVVSFMCREALKGFLARAHTGLSEEVIAKLVDERSTRNLSVTDACTVARILKRLKVVDPACGSGAYLLGMLRELAGLRAALIDDGVDTRSTYDLKLEIIRQNLFGADIDEFAVNLLKFRLWLSLIIDDGGDSPSPLPNLDFTIACGDSLLSRDPQENSHYLGHLARESGIAALKAKYMEASTQAEKDRLRVEITEVQANILSAIGGTGLSDRAIDWQAEFAEIMGDGGFDIVISSPPHQRYQDIEDKPDLLHLYQDAVTARSDLYCYFYARGLQLLRVGGIQTFACSNGWLDTDYGAKLRQHLLKTASIEAIYESAVDRQLSTAPTKTLISVIRKGVNDCGQGTRFIYLMAEFERAVSDANLRRERTLNRAQLVESSIDTNGRGREKYIGDKWGAKYLRAPDIYNQIISRYGSQLVRLGDLAEVRSGITTGVNRFFLLTQETIKRWNVESAYLRPVMTSPLESRSIAIDPTFLPNQILMCHDDISDLSGTGALDYIRWGEDQGYHLKTSAKSRPRWYDLGRKDLVHLAMGKLADKVARSYFSPSGLLFTDNFQVLTVRGNVSASSLCAALNSMLFQLMFFTEARANYSEGVRSIQTRDASNLLIVDPSLWGDMDAVMFASSDWDVVNPSAGRREIDNAIFDALGMTTDERDGVTKGLSELTGMSLMT